MSFFRLTVCFFVLLNIAYGQHEHHGVALDSPRMSHAFSRNLPMNRNGSGTSWNVDASPVFAYMIHKSKWMYMVHGDVFLRYNHQDIFNAGNRGSKKWDIPSMFMLMGQREVGEKGLFHFNTMLSFDPFLVGNNGYPLLFQTGETYQNKPLVDRQHPHDLIGELSISYTHSISKKSDVFLYLGYPGEPAIGPTTYIHRPSAMFNPDAPLSHHWVDATHITFGVATIGYRFGKLKLEASSFTGREPGENRYNFDKPKMDSWSGRISYAPDFNWTMQLSHGFLKQPEWLHPEENVNRSTASITYSIRKGEALFNNFTVLWGKNKVNAHHAEHAALFEGSFLRNRRIMYGRYEWVQKSSEELNLDQMFFGKDIFPVHALTVGSSYELIPAPIKVSIGIQATVYKSPAKLKNLYGSMPLAAEIFMRVYPILVQ